jgi:hypothetical protein
MKSEDKRSKSFWKTWWLWILILASVIFWALILSVFNPLARIEKAKQSQSENVTPTQAPEFSDAYKKELSQTFCEKRSKALIRSVNLDDFILMYKKAGETVTLRPANGVYPTTENCQKVVDLCLNLWGKEECQNIADTKIWIGMDKEELILSWGLPKDRNNTVNSFGVSSQWVYGNFGPYVYLEGKDENSMTVASWQD